MDIILLEFGIRFYFFDNKKKAELDHKQLRVDNSFSSEGSKKLILQKMVWVYWKIGRVFSVHKLFRFGVLMAKRIKNAEQKKTVKKSFWELHASEIIIFAFAFLLFSNSIFNSYNMDDDLVTQNHHLTSKGLSAIGEIFSSPYYQDNSGHSYEYRPVVLVSFALEHQFFGDNPHISHSINVLLYALCCVLLYVVLQTLITGVSPLILLGVTLLYAAHPSHTEVVCSIKNRDEIFALFFSLSSLFVALKAINNRGRFWLYALLPVLYLLALMSKLSSVTFAVIIPISLILFAEIGFKRLLLLLILFGLPTLFMLNGVTLYYKLQIELGLALVVLLFYALHDFAKLYIQVPLIFKAIFRKDHVSADMLSYNNVSEIKESFLFSIKLASNSWSLRAVVYTVAAAGLFISGIALKYPPLLLASAFVLTIFELWGEEKVAWWANVVFYLCLTLAITKYNLGHTIYGNLVSIGLFYQVFWGEKKLFFPSLLLLLLFCVLAPPSISLGIGNVALVAFRWRRTWIIAAVYLIGGLYSSYNDVFVVGDSRIWSNAYGVFLGIFLIMSLYFEKWTKYLVHLYKILAIVVLVGYQIEWSKPTSANYIKNDIQNSIELVGRQVNTNIFSIKQDRPISFIEQPVTKSDSWEIRLGTSLEILAHYAYKVVLPYPMAFYYGYQFIKPQSIFAGIPILSLLIYLALGVLVLVLQQKHKEIAIGLIIYLISVAAVSNYFIAIPGMLGDRFLFIPSLGWCIVFVFLLVKLFKLKDIGYKSTIDFLPKGAKYCFGGILLLYSTITFSRNFDWKDDITLFRHDIDYVQESAQANNLFAIGLMKCSYEVAPINRTAYISEAISHFKKALEIYPGFYNVNFDLGRAYSILNQPDSSIAYFKRAIAIDSSNSDAQLSVGKLLFQEKRADEAIPYFNYVIANRKTPSYAAYESLSFIYFIQKDYDKSIAINKQAIEQMPMLPDPLINIARVFVFTHQPDSARLYLNKALTLSPGNQIAIDVLKQIQ